MEDCGFGIMSLHDVTHPSVQKNEPTTVGEPPVKRRKIVDQGSGRNVRKRTRPSSTDCRGTIFSTDCEGTKMEGDLYFCKTCKTTWDENQFLPVARIVEATDEGWKNKNKQSLSTYRCKRLMIGHKSHYVLESTDAANAVLATRKCTPYNGSKNPDNTITYHWSGKGKKYLFGPKPNSRNPCINCAKDGCNQPGNRACELNYCSKHCRERGSQVKCGVHARDKPSLATAGSIMKTPAHTQRLEDALHDARWQAVSTFRKDPPFEEFFHQLTTEDSNNNSITGDISHKPGGHELRMKKIDGLVSEVVRQKRARAKPVNRAKPKKLHNSSLFSHNVSRSSSAGMQSSKRIKKEPTNYTPLAPSLMSSMATNSFSLQPYNTAYFYSPITAAGAMQKHQIPTPRQSSSSSSSIQQTTSPSFNDFIRQTQQHGHHQSLDNFFGLGDAFSPLDFHDSGFSPVKEENTTGLHTKFVGFPGSVPGLDLSDTILNM